MGPSNVVKYEINWLFAGSPGTIHDEFANRSRNKTGSSKRSFIRCGPSFPAPVITFTFNDFDHTVLRRSWTTLCNKLITHVWIVVLEKLAAGCCEAHEASPDAFPVLLLGRFTTFSQNLIKIDSIAFFALVA